jgi:hypothetical protein
LAAELGIVSNNVVHWDINFVSVVHDWVVDSVPLCSMFFILLGWVEEVGRPQKEELLRSNTFTRSFFPTLTRLSFGRAFGGLRLL